MKRESVPTIDRLIAASEVLTWLGERARELPEDRDSGATMALHLALANLYVGEFATHLAGGAMEPYDALLATARGDMKLSQSQIDMFRALTSPPKE